MRKSDGNKTMPRISIFSQLGHWFRITKTRVGFETQVKKGSTCKKEVKNTCINKSIGSSKLRLEFSTNDCT